MDPRREAPLQDAAKLAVEIADKLRANPDSIDQLVGRLEDRARSAAGQRPDTIRAGFSSRSGQSEGSSSRPTSATT
jgi:hypothetical protein